MRSALASAVGLVCVAAAAVLTPSERPVPPAVQAASVAADPEAVYRENNLGVADLEQYRYAAAAAAFRRALALDADNRLARINLAIALFYVPDVAGARQHATIAVERWPDAPQPHYLLGLLARGENRPEEGVAAFERVLAIDPTDLGALVNLGQLRLQQRRYDAAVEAFRAAVEREPLNSTAAYNLAVSLSRAGRAQEGAAAMARFQQLRVSGYATTFSNVYLEQGRYAEALVSTGAEAGLVDRTVPDVTFTTEQAVQLVGGPSSGARRSADFGEARRLDRALALADLDGDGDLDLVSPERVWRNERGSLVSVADLAGTAGATAIIAADYDNDLKPDLFLAGRGWLRLFRQEPGGRFSDVSAGAAIPPYAGVPRSAAFADVDHDGDVDIVIGGDSEPAESTPPEGRGLPAGDLAAPLLLLRNNGNGTFADVAAQAGLPSRTRLSAIVATDHDNRRDVDLLVASPDRPLALYGNQRDGTFRDVAAAVGLDVDGVTAVAAGDVNKDDFTDFFLARAAQPGLFALSDGRGRFTTLAGPAETRGAGAAQLLDYDGDGLLDLLTSGAGGPRLWRGVGGHWEEVTERALSASPAAGHGSLAATHIASGDLDGDGDLDLLLAGAGGVRRLRNDGDARRRGLGVRLAGRVSNRSAVGTKVELRAGALRSRVEIYAASPAPAPADIVFGLGGRTRADIVRLLWPSGIVQAERVPPSVSAITLTEADRKPSSCPLLFTWNGERFQFVTDFMGGGEMGAWQAPGVWNTPDPDEYVRIPPGALVPRDGRYELRVTNELEETLYVDRLQLVAIAHPPDTDVYPNEGLRAPFDRPPTLFVTRHAAVPPRVLDHAGRDVTGLIAQTDRRVVDGLPLERVRGYAQPHALTIDLGPTAGDRAVLLLTGWTDYAFSSDHVAAHQAGLTLTPPALEVRGADGAWVRVIDQIGIPVGRPQTVPVDLSGRFLSPSRQVRITTSMRVYWDQILADTSGRAAVLALPAAASPASGGLSVVRLDAVQADLRWRGFSKEISPDGREPPIHDYDKVSTVMPWKQMAGRYTREGDVRELLARTDDRFVVSRPGDEVAIAFDASALPALAAGERRTLLLHAHGYSKEMNPRSASPDSIEPLPFGAMPSYPYPPSAAYPDTLLHRAYRELYNSRGVARTLPPLEQSVPDQPPH